MDKLEKVEITFDLYRKLMQDNKDLYQAFEVIERLVLSQGSNSALSEAYEFLKSKGYYKAL